MIKYIQINLGGNMSNRRKRREYIEEFKLQIVQL